MAAPTPLSPPPNMTIRLPISLTLVLLLFGETGFKIFYLLHYFSAEKNNSMLVSHRVGKNGSSQVSTSKMLTITLHQSTIFNGGPVAVGGFSKKPFSKTISSLL